MKIKHYQEQRWKQRIYLIDKITWLILIGMAWLILGVWAFWTPTLGVYDDQPETFGTDFKVYVSMKSSKELNALACTLKSQGNEQALLNVVNKEIESRRVRH